jgi:hypothetical protein
VAKPLLSRKLVTPLAALTDDRLTYSEKAVLFALYSFHGKEGKSVYPSRAQLSKRSGINSLPRISTITNQLGEYGWLSKRKVGVQGRNNYRLTIPMHAYWSSFGDALGNINFESIVTDAVIVTPAVTPIVISTVTPIVTSDITTNKQTILTNHINKPYMGESDLFNIFYDEYPKQVGRKKAHQTWLVMNPSQQDLDAMLINISDRLIRGVWSKDYSQYIPHPANYLSGEQWNDELISRNANDQRNKLSPAEQFRANAASSRNMG